MTMESIEHTVSELSNHFKSTMAEFQQSLTAATTAGNSASDLATQFCVFRSFVLSALAGLQSQVELLTRHNDNMEMRSRRKMLLVHGVPECSNEKVASVAVKILSNHLKLPEMNLDSVSQCQRLGKPKNEKARPILIKFKDVSVRNKLWFTKTGLKGTGVTLSEFLTKERHDVFLAARLRFGVNKCWTKDGNIVVIDPNGSQQRVTSMAVLNSIVCTPASRLEPSSTATPSNPTTTSQRTKRNARK